MTKWKWRARAHFVTGETAGSRDWRFCPQVEVATLDHRHFAARRFYEREGWQLEEQTAPESNNLFRLLHYRRDL